MDAAVNDQNPSKDEIAQLKRSKLLLIEKSARMIVDICFRYGFYPDLLFSKVLSPIIFTF